MDWKTFTDAFNEAKRTISIADSHVVDMSRMVAGRLKKSGVGHGTLVELKKELADYNMHTGTWK